MKYTAAHHPEAEFNAWNNDQNNRSLSATWKPEVNKGWLHPSLPPTQLESTDSSVIGMRPFWDWSHSTCMSKSFLGALFMAQLLGWWHSVGWPLIGYAGKAINGIRRKLWCFIERHEAMLSGKPAGKRVILAGRGSSPKLFRTQHGMICRLMLEGERTGKVQKVKVILDWSLTF